MDAPNESLSVELTPSLHYALRQRAKDPDRPISEIVSEAIVLLLQEDAEDTAALAERANEPSRPFSDFVDDLERQRSQ